MSENSIHVGIDLGGTKIEGVVLQSGFDNAKEINDFILHRERVDTNAENGYEYIVERLCSFIKKLIRNTSRKSRLITIGVGLPGSIKRSNGQVKNSNTTCLNDRPFWTDVQKMLNMPIAFENDANCFALAEAVWGAGNGYTTVFGVILGTGVGGGIIFNKKIHSGLQSIAGEWGHSIIHPGGHHCYCGKAGCVETYLSGPAFEKNIVHAHGFNLTGKKFTNQWENGILQNKEEAQNVVREYCKYFGMAVSNVINIIDPDVIVLGGGMSNASFLYTTGLESIAKFVFNDELITEVKKAELGDSAGVFGAAYLGAQSL